MVIHTPAFSATAEEAEVILVSGSHQTVLENSLVARRVAESLGIRVEHVIDPCAARALGPARFPEEGQIAALFPNPLPGAGPDRDLEAAIAAGFEAVREGAGGSTAAVRVLGDPEAPLTVTWDMIS